MIGKDLTPQQIDGIEQLKRRTINDLPPKLLVDESLFYRFMKARDFNVENAEDMLRKHIVWREEYKADAILEHKPSEVALKYISMNFIGYDNEGCPVRYIDIGNSDPIGVMNSLTKADILKYNLQIIEQDVVTLRKQSDKLGRPVTNIVYLYNLENLTFVKATSKRVIEMSMLCLKVYQDNYPERIKKIYVINASFYFTLLFSLVKSIIAPAVLDKIRIFGSDGWKETLLEIMDPDDLPAFLGGNKTDPDGNPLCNSFIIHGSPVPEHYYFSQAKRRFSLLPGVKKLKLAPFAKTDLKFEVDEPDSVLEWEFETKSKDIGFGVYYKSSTEPKVLELVPKQRIETCFEPEEGLYKCEKTGVYTIVFDNSYSWIYPKEIYYRVNILGPKEEEIE